SVRQSLRQGGKSPLRPLPILGSLLLTLALSPRAHAVTYVTVDGHPNPVTLVEGETVTIRLDTAKPGASVQIIFARDLSGTAKFDATAPFNGPAPVTDGG